MTYPQQPGNWDDQSWPTPSPTGYPDPGHPMSGQPMSGHPVSGHPMSGHPVSKEGYAPPPYPAYGYPVMAPPTNSMAVASLVCSLAGLATCIAAPVGAVLGHVARRQIRERGEGGEGMAVAGIIIGWIITGLLLFLIALYVVLIIIAIAAETSSP